MFFGMGKM